MFTDYQESVLSTYEKLRDESKLSPRLVRPTTANLRDECIRKFDEGLAGADEVNVKAFFNLVGDKDNYRASIVSVDTDVFRPLVKLIKRRLVKTDLKNIELLAWLIDFSPRPNAEFVKTPSGATYVDPEGGREIRITTKKSKIIISIIGIMLIIICSGAFLWWRNGYIINSVSYSANAKCMEWVGNRYEPVDCNKKSGNAEILPLDQRKILRFHRIMLRDTLTRDALGKVWVVNVKGGAEFFTDSGTYPVDSTKKLRPVTTYMLAKYTSYPRYLLNMFIWIVSGISCGILYWAWAYFFMRKLRKIQSSN